MISLNVAPKISEEYGSVRRILGFGATVFLLCVLVPGVFVWFWEWRLPSNVDLERVIAEAKRKTQMLQGEIQQTEKSLTKALQEHASRRNERHYTEMLQEMLHVLPERIPVDVFMTSLSAEKWELVMEGGARDSTSIAQFLEAMKRTYPFMFFEVEEMRKAVVEQYVVDVFRLKGKLKNPKLVHQE